MKECCSKPSLVSKAEKAAHDVAHNVKDAVKSFSDDPKGAAYKAGRKLRETLDAANDEIHHAGDVAAREIRKRPLEAAMAALGVGAVLGWLLGHRK